MDRSPRVRRDTWGRAVDTLYLPNDADCAFCQDLHIFNITLRPETPPIFNRQLFIEINEGTLILQIMGQEQTKVTTVNFRRLINKEYLVDDAVWN